MSESISGELVPTATVVPIVDASDRAAYIGKKAWEASLEDFNRSAAEFSLDEAACEVRNNLRELRGAFKDGMQRYYAIGRWLNYIRQTYGHGHWEAFLAACEISKGQAHRYRALAKKCSPEDLKSFVGKTFSLDRVVGYVRKKPLALPAPAPQSVDDTIAHTLPFPAPAEPTETDTDEGPAASSNGNQKPKRKPKSKPVVENHPGAPVILPLAVDEDEEAQPDEDGDEEDRTVELWFNTEDEFSVEYIGVHLDSR